MPFVDKKTWCETGRTHRFLDIIHSCRQFFVFRIGQIDAVVLFNDGCKTLLRIMLDLHRMEAITSAQRVKRQWNKKTYLIVENETEGSWGDQTNKENDDDNEKLQKRKEMSSKWPRIIGYRSQKCKKLCLNWKLTSLSLEWTCRSYDISKAHTYRSSHQREISHEFH